MQTELNRILQHNAEAQALQCFKALSTVLERINQPATDEQHALMRLHIANAEEDISASLRAYKNNSQLMKICKADVELHVATVADIYRCEYHSITLIDKELLKFKESLKSPHPVAQVNA